MIPFETISSQMEHRSSAPEYNEKSESALEIDAGRLMEEKKLVRKLDKRILPLACFLYLFACESEHNP